MNKINFQNLPSTTTPLNATNLNALQDNVEDVFDGDVPAGNMVVDSIRSKNMLDFSSFPTQTINGITFTNNGDGSLKINGTASQAFGVNFIQFKIKAGNYYLSINESGSLPNAFYLYDHDSNVGYGNGAITLSQDFTHMGFDTYIQSGDTFNNITIYPQLEKGTSATSYSPYQTLVFEDTGWIEANLSSNVSNVYLRPKYRKIGKIVQVIGEVDCTDLSQNAQILTGLPQPVGLIRIPTSYSNGIAQTYLSNDGTLCCVYGIGNTLFLNFMYLAN